MPKLYGYYFAARSRTPSSCPYIFATFFEGLGKAGYNGKRGLPGLLTTPSRRHESVTARSQKAAAAFASHLPQLQVHKFARGLGSGVAIACTTECQELVTRMWAKSCRALPLGCRPGSMASATLRERAEPLSPWAPVPPPKWCLPSSVGADSSTPGSARGSVFEDDISMDACRNSSRMMRITWVARGPGPTLRLKEGRSCGGIDFKVHTTN